MSMMAGDSPRTDRGRNATTRASLLQRSVDGLRAAEAPAAARFAALSAAKDAAVHAGDFIRAEGARLGVAALEGAVCEEVGKALAALKAASASPRGGGTAGCARERERASMAGASAAGGTGTGGGPP